MKRRRIVLLAAIGLLGVVMTGVWLWATASRRALRAFKAELIAKGEVLDLGRSTPTTTADAREASRTLLETIAALPVSNPEGVIPNHCPQPMRPLGSGKAEVAWRRPNIPRQKSGQPFTWEQLAAELEAQHDNLQSACRVLEAPAMDRPLNYNAGWSLSLPHLSGYLRLRQWLSVEACLSLHDHDLPKAISQIRSMMRLVHLTRNEPLIISQRVRGFTVDSCFRNTWEALQAEGWTDPQLAELQQAWQTNEFVKTMGLALEMQRAMTVDMFVRCREDPAEFRSVRSVTRSINPPAPTTGGNSFDRLVRGLSGVGSSAEWSLWSYFRSYDDERISLRSVQVLLEACRNGVPTGGVAALSADRELAGVTIRAYPFSAVFVSNLNPPVLAAWHTQTQRDIAVAAIALKRFQLRNQRLPEELEELVPAFVDRVPRDWMNGQPLRYRLKPAGGFVLYSVGDNGVDDGGHGSEVRAAPGGVSLDLDLIWPEPATPEETAAADPWKITAPPPAP